LYHRGCPICISSFAGLEKINFKFHFLYYPQRIMGSLFNYVIK
jgi:hypothetical protein